RFDTALINTGTGGLTGASGYRIGQVRVVFSIPGRLAATLFPHDFEVPQHLAYIEWFSPSTARPEANHLMYKIRRSHIHGDRMASIVPLVNIRRSIHLLPKFGAVAPADWKSSNVLEKCDTFFANPWSDRHMYTTLI
ncbi:hypothetical protein DFH08DRAFT_721908, partial [Mycena albidolilacea]